jgi:ankyrin repeat protein
MVNKRGDNIIHAAAAFGGFTLLQTLVMESQIDINKRIQEGETALLCACRSGHPNSVNFLLDRGAQPSIQSTVGKVPLIG